MLILNKYKNQNIHLIKNKNENNNLKLITFSKTVFLRSFITLFSFFFYNSPFSIFFYKSSIKNKKNLNHNLLLVLDINYDFLSFY